MRLNAFKLREWSDSRWCGVGRAARAFVGAIMLGISSLVEYALAKGHSECYLQSFRKVDAAMNKVFVAAALASLLADSCQQQLLEDDRLPWMLGELGQDKK